MQITQRELLRVKGAFYAELELANENLEDNALMDAMLAYPILINRPIVETKKGTKLCRPSELVLQLLDNANIGVFIKEDGEVVNISAK